MPKTDHRKNLTPSLISGLNAAPAAKRYPVMDSQVPGFATGPGYSAGRCSIPLKQLSGLRGKGRQFPRSIGSDYSLFA
jgi:hypothetical protein